MKRTILRHCIRTASILGFLLVAAVGCDRNVVDPTRIEQHDLDNATGADLMRRNALRQMNEIANGGPVGSGMLADEYETYNPTDLMLPLDARTADQTLADQAFGAYQPWQEARKSATFALEQIRAYMPEPLRTTYAGQMLALRGFASLRLAEDYCSGFPLHELNAYTPVYGPSLTSDQALSRALADLDSALVLAADSTRILNFARLARGRTLLALGKFADAAAAVAPVPTTYVLNAEYDPSNWRTWNISSLAVYGQFGPPWSVADMEGGNGLNFVSANDPRLQTVVWRTLADGTRLYDAKKFATFTSPQVIASGIEARLIEAEGALNNGNGDWLEILNGLRATQINPAMSPLADPGTAAARADLLFRERAFWLFGTGHRLSDLRRLIRHYGRSSDAIFPSGSHVTGTAYGSVTSYPFPAKLETPFNPAVTGCTDQ